MITENYEKPQSSKNSSAFDLGTFALSAFGDEVAVDLEEQLRVLVALRIHGLELRTAWGKNVAQLSDDEARRAQRLCDENGVVVTCLGSPVGKSPLADAPDFEEKRLRRLLEIATIVGARRVRVFSFYPPESAEAATSEAATDAGASMDALVAQSAQRLTRLAEIAARAGVELLLENERDLIGDIPTRCAAILGAVSSPSLRFAWDSANFVLSGAPHPFAQGWPLLQAFTSYVHIKDARLADGTVCVAGDGDGDISIVLQRLKNDGYRGVLALEPHLAVAGHSSGFSGADGLERATIALRRVLDSIGAAEISVRDL